METEKGLNKTTQAAIGRLWDKYSARREPFSIDAQKFQKPDGTMGDGLVVKVNGVIVETYRDFEMTSDLN